jgi:membrane protein
MQGRRIIGMFSIWMRKLEQRLLTPFAQTPMRQINHIFRVIYIAAREFQRDHCFERAAGLAYATIISLIPLSVLFFSLISLFGWGEQIVGFIESSVFPYVVPDFQEQLKTVIHDYISPTVFSLRTISFLNISALIALFLAAIGIWLMAERVFNYIWNVRETRNYLQKFVTFWVVLTISPFLFLFSIYLGNAFSDSGEMLAILQPYVSFIYSTILPSLLAFGAFLVLFLFFPATSVRIGSAAVAALFSLILWEFLRQAFDLYILRAVKYTNFYKQIASIPLFFIWIYSIWLIILFGAELSYSHQNYRYLRYNYLRRQKKPAFSLHFLAFFLLARIYHAYRDGTSLPAIGNLAEEIGISPGTLSNTAAQLISMGILGKVKTDEECYTFLRDPATIDLHEMAAKLLEIQLSGEVVWDGKRILLQALRSNQGNDEPLGKAYNRFLQSFRGQKIADLAAYFESH